MSPRYYTFSINRMYFPIERAVLFFVLLDLFVGGNGYLIEIAGLRVREILFGACMLLVFTRIAFYRDVQFPGFVWGLLATFVATTALSTIIGVAGGSNIENIISELKPLSYFPMLLFFLLAIRDEGDIKFVSGLIVACGIFQAFIFLFIIFGSHLKFLEYTDVYRFLKQSDEFIFRHNPIFGPFIGFFYKGAFYLCPAILFLLFDNRRWSKLLVSFLILACALTLTRGLIAALIVSFLAGCILKFSWRHLVLTFFAGTLAGTLVYFALQAERCLLIASGDSEVEQSEIKQSDFCFSFFDKRRLSDPEKLLKWKKWLESESPNESTLIRTTDSIRLKDIRTVWSELDLSMFIYGRGLGAIIGERSRIEMNYLEIFYKQGIIGLAFWISIILYMFYMYINVESYWKNYSLAFFLCGVFVFAITATNTFLTGSIGMALVWIAFAALHVLTKFDADHRVDGNMNSFSWYDLRWISLGHQVNTK